MKAVAIDDEMSGLEVIKAHSKKVPFLILDNCFVDALEGLEFIQNHKIDLIFLDVKMPDISGIDFYNSLIEKPILIFTTAYPEYAISGFDLDAIDYLLKPISFPRFLKSCNKALDVFNTRGNSFSADYIYLKDGLEHHKIFLKELLYIKAEGNYVTFYFKDKKLMVRITFLEALELIPPKQHVRIHRSFAVSLDKIVVFDSQYVTLQGGKKIPIGRVYKEELEKKTKR